MAAAGEDEADSWESRGRRWFGGRLGAGGRRKQRRVEEGDAQDRSGCCEGCGRAENFGDGEDGGGIHADDNVLF